MYVHLYLSDKKMDICIYALCIYVNKRNDRVWLEFTSTDYLKKQVAKTNLHGLVGYNQHGKLIVNQQSYRGAFETLPYYFGI